MCERESREGGKDKREGAQMETKKDKTMWEFGSTLKESKGKKIMVGLFLEA